MIEKLIQIFSTFPNLGSRSAKRIVLHLVENKGVIEHLIELLSNAKESLRFCNLCNNIGERDICSICSNKNRRQDVICVVDNIEDLWNIESSNCYKGLYFIPERKNNLSRSSISEIQIKKLIERIRTDKIKEIILANSPTIKGQTNAFYIIDLISDIIKENDLTIELTILGKGIPVGSEIDYLDEGTIKAAFSSRKIAA